MRHQLSAAVNIRGADNALVRDITVMESVCRGLFICSRMTGILCVASRTLVVLLQVGGVCFNWGYSKSVPRA